DFPIKHFCVDPEAKYAAVHFSSEQSVGELALVNLEERKIVRRQVISRIPVLAMDTEFIYVATINDSNVYKLDKLTLEIKEKINLPSPVWYRPIEAKGDEDTRRLQALMAAAVANRTNAAIRRMPGGYFTLGQDVYDAKGGFCCIADVGKNGFEPSYSSFKMISLVGDRGMRRLTMGTLDDQTIVLTKTSDHRDAGQRFYAHDLTANRLASFDVNPTDSSGLSGRREKIVDFELQRSRLVIAQGSYLLSTEITDDDFPVTPKSPLRIIPPRIPVGSSESGFTARVEVAGSGRAGARFSVVTPVPYISIVADTGVLSMDLPSIWKAVLADLKGSPLTGEKNMRGLGMRLHEGKVSTGSHKLAAGETVLSIPFKLVVRSGDKESSLSLLYPMIVPKREYLLASKSRNASNVESPLKETESQRDPTPAPQRRSTTRSAATPSPVKTAPDVAAKLRRMEAILDNILQRLDAIEGKQGSRR
ncbi:MAG: hypothetical protein AAF497_07250, partial [Planctomycetota bacterium]